MLNAATIARAGLAGIALVILSVSLAEAEYGPRTKIGTNYQQTSTTMSANGITESNCNGHICYFLLQVAPAQKALIVQHVSCRLHVDPGELIEAILRTRQGQTLPLRTTVLVPVPTTNGWWLVNSPVMHLVKSGERPFIVFTNSTNAIWQSDAQCTISGQLQ